MQRSLSLAICQNCHIANPSSWRPAKLIAHLPMVCIWANPGARSTGKWQGHSQENPFLDQDSEEESHPRAAITSAPGAGHTWAAPALSLRVEFNQYLPAAQSCRVKMKEERIWLPSYQLSVLASRQ